MAKKYIILDTETTGLEVQQGHRVIEIGAVLINDRNKSEEHFHTYINPTRLIDEEASKVHGIMNEDLIDKPLFEDIAEEFLEFIDGSTLVIHNAAFDVGFLNNELAIQKTTTITDDKIIDTLVLARKKHPGMPNNLDALCKRYNISEQKRGLHDAKSDCELLAQVYIELIGGRQSNLDLNKLEESNSSQTEKIKPKFDLLPTSTHLKIVRQIVKEKDFYVLFGDKVKMITFKGPHTKKFINESSNNLINFYNTKKF